jgi:hypothetical protein
MMGMGLVVQQHNDTTLKIMIWRCVLKTSTKMKKDVHMLIRCNLGVLEMMRIQEVGGLFPLAI